MTESEKMLAGLIYDPADCDIMAEQGKYLDALWEFNQLKPSQIKEKQEYMKKTFAQCGDGNYIELPFHANWGGKNVHFGSHIYANFNLTLVDDGDIFVGDNVLFGPNVVIATPNHPANPEMRANGLQYNKPVRICDNVWLGAGVIVVPGVTIGKNSIIGAGSVVTKDIPENVIAFGNPCKVAKHIAEYYINEHSSIKVTKGKTLYFDPYNIIENSNDADYIFITHEHYDHYSPEDIKKVINNNTVIICPVSMQKSVNTEFDNKVIGLAPGENLNIDKIYIEAIPAYNIDKPYHPKEKGWLGYVVTIENESFYVCGDTDDTEEGRKVKCDIVFVPVGGTYTMNHCEAAEFVKNLTFKKAVPTHYGTVVGSKKDGQSFLSLLN